MSWDYRIIKKQGNSLDTLFIQAYLRDTAVSPQVRLVEGIVPISGGLGDLNLQGLWDNGTIVPGGAKLWRQMDLRDAGDNARDVVDALFESLRTPGSTLAQATTAGAGVLADNTKQQALYNRLTTLFAGATAAERNQFIVLCLTISLSKAGQR
jgi:hypothetical protein